MNYNVGCSYQMRNKFQIGICRPIWLKKSSRLKRCSRKAVAMRPTVDSFYRYIKDAHQSTRQSFHLHIVFIDFVLLLFRRFAGCASGSIGHKSSSNNTTTTALQPITPFLRLALANFFSSFPYCSRLES